MKPRSLLFVLFIQVLAFLPSGASAQYTTENKANPGTLSAVQSEERGFGKSHEFRQAKRPKAQGRTLIGDVFSDSIKNCFDNQGFTTYETLQKEMEKHTPPLPQKPAMDFPLASFFQMKPNPSSTMAPLVLPEVMQAPPTPNAGKPRYDPFRPDPSLIPPHLQAQNAATNDATDSMRDELPLVKNSPEDYQTTGALDNLPVLQPPKTITLEETAPQTPVSYPAIPMLPSRTLFPLAQPTPLSEEQRAYNRGLDAFRYRNYIKARQTFSDLAKTSPDSAHAQFGYGLSLFYAGEYESSLQALGNGYRIAKQNGAPEPTLWDLNVDPSDFRFHHKKLTRYVNANRDDKTAGTLLFLLTHAGVTPPKPPNQKP